MKDFTKLREWIQKILGKRSKTDYIVFLLVGVLLMLIAIPTGEETKKKPEKETETQLSGTDEVRYEETYREQLERQLEKLLSRMDGVGKCEVMITLEDDGQTYVDKNVTTDADRRQEETVVYDTGDKKVPYVILKKKPKVAGVVVVTEGGSNAKVVTNISNSVMSLFQLETHKITVVKMSVQEE